MTKEFFRSDFDMVNTQMSKLFITIDYQGSTYQNNSRVSSRRQYYQKSRNINAG